ncbi:MAG: response regulator [Spirochaetaceae bacterium]
MINRYKLSSLYSFTKILVVDDVFYLKRTISNILTDAGYFVLSASSGTEAIEKFKKYSPDFIATSETLCDMTALDLILRIREEEEVKRTRFIFVSARKDTDRLRPELTDLIDIIATVPINKFELELSIKDFLPK